MEKGELGNHCHERQEKKTHDECKEKSKEKELLEL